MTAMAGRSQIDGDARTRQWYWLLISVLVIALDQWTKYLVSHALNVYDQVAVFSFFNLTLAHNPGIAFSLLDSGRSGVRWGLTVIAAVVSIGLILWILRLPRKDAATALSLSLILGGALGNVIDRLRYGHVVDFLDFHIGEWHWPAFNVADSSITVGAVILVVTTLMHKRVQ